jgi:hypothetical protein
MTRSPAPLAAALLLAGCAGDSGRDDRAASPSRSDRAPAERPAALEPARCPPGLPDCRTASGRIVYVERVDADGDGDAHFILVSRDSITGPGISTIDVKRSLRPEPLPGLGDRLSAAGQVFRGRFGQKQIEAVEVHVARGR